MGMRPTASGAPATLWLAAAVLLTEAVGLCVAAVFTAVDTANGQSSTKSSGIALTLLAFAGVLAVALLARGLAQAKSWSHTPAAMVQLFTGGIAIYLLDGHRFEWGVPAIALAVLGLAALLSPPTVRALPRRQAH